ncbi:hypothetical protein [Alteribacter natronophilus]|uniref:hypothetical protein n=1 Tax=Alteribacter natronophilus TaxID=2583810 RepID=UPI00110E65CE|nr:hypothetical protein [Alteribacter natronophilus]TMW72955.1 hypothetical protein FGB90_01195 [Alteribacter natronophilus]
MKSRHSYQQKKQDDSKLQLEQKILHYRSEISKYKQQIQELESRLTMRENPEKQSSREKIEVKQEPVISAKAYFSHSVFLPRQEEEQDHQIHIIGHLTLENTGNQILHDPVFCFRTKPSSRINIGGKIRMRQQQERTWLKPQEEWIYVQNDWREWVKTRGEHWLKPVHIDTVKPGERAVFTNFDITAEPGPEDEHLLIEGFCYTREMQKGISSVNTISLYL